MISDHPHPCNFRLKRYTDRGWGEFAFEYQWDSSSGKPATAGEELPDLDHCSVYEFTVYEAAPHHTRQGWFAPVDSPFESWRLRNPTDGRTAHVGLESFSASQGRAWDRHRLAGPLCMPIAAGVWTIRAIQQYRFHCALCGSHFEMDGPAAGPHAIDRTFRTAKRALVTGIQLVGRYEITKHRRTAWMEMSESGFAGDSACLNVAPEWLTAPLQLRYFRPTLEC